MANKLFSFFKQGNDTYEVKDAQARTDIAAISSAITTKRRFVVISDSYGLGRNDTTPWTTYLKQFLGASNADYFTYSAGSMGFAHVGDNNYIAKTLLEANASNITDHNTITDIVFGLGINDLGETPADIRGAISTLIAYCKATYPNAKIWCGFIGNTNTKNVTNYITAIEAIYDSFNASKNCIVMDGIENLMHIQAWLQSDGVHPTTTGSSEIAKFAIQFLNGGHPIFKFKKECTVAAGFLNGKIEIMIEGHDVMIKPILDEVSSAISIPNRNLVTVGSVDYPIKFPSSGYIPMCPGQVYTSANEYEQCLLWMFGTSVGISVPTGASGKTIVTNAHNYFAGPVYINLLYC